MKISVGKLLMVPFIVGTELISDPIFNAVRLYYVRHLFMETVESKINQQGFPELAGRDRELFTINSRANYTFEYLRKKSCQFSHCCRYFGVKHQTAILPAIVLENVRIYLGDDDEFVHFLRTREIFLSFWSYEHLRNDFLDTKHFTKNVGYNPVLKKLCIELGKLVMTHKKDNPGGAKSTMGLVFREYIRSDPIPNFDR